MTNSRGDLIMKDRVWTEFQTEYGKIFISMDEICNVSIQSHRTPDDFRDTSFGLTYNGRKYTFNTYASKNGEYDAGSWSRNRSASTIAQVSGVESYLTESEALGVFNEVVDTRLNEWMEYIPTTILKQVRNTHDRVAIENRYFCIEELEAKIEDCKKLISMVHNEITEISKGKYMPKHTNIADDVLYTLEDD
jgi:hypothetical protein